MSSRHLVLLGLMGAGKTSVAVRVAALLDRPVRDSDLDLAERYGMTAATFMERYGRTALHAWEVDHLTRAMAEPPAAVIAPAASVVEDPGCRALLADAYVVWLDAPVEVLARRAARGVHRPWDGSDPVTALAGRTRQPHGGHHRRHARGREPAGGGGVRSRRRPVTGP